MDEEEIGRDFATFPAADLYTKRGEGREIDGRMPEM